MLTYVINTSENKTFDSSMLFDLAGYSKIRWMQCPLHEVQSCAKTIFEKQNVLGAESFRVAVIVDFFNFDRIRIPYGRRGFVADTGVDMSLYMPYIEIFLLDNFIAYLEKKDLFVADFEIYYVQNEKSEHYELFENAKSQLEQIMKGGVRADDFRNDREGVCGETAGITYNHAGFKSSKKQQHPSREDVKCRAVEDFTPIGLTFKENSRVISLRLPSGWIIKDCDPNTHLILCDGNRIGKISTFAPLEAVDTLESKHYDIDDVGLDYDLRLVAVGEDMMFRYVLSFTIPDKDNLENIQRLYVEIDYAQMDKDAITYLLRYVGVGCFDERGLLDGKPFPYTLLQVNDIFYKSFSLYCTPDVSLEFKLVDYPYGADEMTFSQFWEAFRQRQTLRAGIRRHYYIVPYGGGPSRAALDTLSLSLYLIRMYEREEKATDEGDMEVFHLDSSVLKEVLEAAWSKVNAAQNYAKKSNMTYYSLQQEKPTERPQNSLKSMTAEEREKAIAEAIAKERQELPRSEKDRKCPSEDIYAEIEGIVSCRPGEFSKKSRKEFDKIMSEYLRMRDATKETDVEEEFESRKMGGFLKTADRCPSREEYNHLVGEKKKDISDLFEEALSAEYIKVDYSEERKTANEAIRDHKRAKACLARNIVGDILFLLLAVGAMFVPYYLLQLTSHTSSAPSAVFLGIAAAAFFGGIFVCSVLLRVLPLLRKLKNSKKRLYNCCLDCRAKEKYSFSALRRRYERDLIAIEHARYDLRQLKHLFDANVAKETSIAAHRDMLDRLEDCLSSILNNLDVEPAIDPYDNVEGMVDFSKPIHARENRLYQIFSVETIEKMFPKKGRDER